MTNTTPVHGTTLVARQSYQGISIEFDLSGMNSDYSDQKTIYEVINGETCWILITGNFTRMKHVDTRI